MLIQHKRPVATVVSTPGGGTEVELRTPTERVVSRRVVLLDDHGLFLAGVRAELGDVVKVVGEAGTVAAAIPLIKELEPEVVMLDVHLSDGSGEAISDAVAPERRKSASSRCLSPMPRWT